MWFIVNHEHSPSSPVRMIMILLFRSAMQFCVGRPIIAAHPVTGERSHCDQSETTSAVVKYCAILPFNRLNFYAGQAGFAILPPFPLTDLQECPILNESAGSKGSAAVCYAAHVLSVLYGPHLMRGHLSLCSASGVMNIPGLVPFTLGSHAVAVVLEVDAVLHAAIRLFLLSTRWARLSSRSLFWLGHMTLMNL